MPGPPLEPKGPIEGLQLFHGERPYNRRTRGSPERTYAIALLNGVADDGKAIGPHCDLPELRELARELADSWASHLGWDTDQAIEMVKAGTGVRLNPLVNDQEMMP